MPIPYIVLSFVLTLNAVVRAEDMPRDSASGIVTEGLATQAVPAKQARGGDVPPKKESDPWRPAGSLGPVRVRCQASELEREAKRISPSQIIPFYKSYLARCGKSLDKGTYNRFFTLLDFSDINYQFKTNARIRKVRYTLSSGIKLRGLLGIKKDGIRRPLIVARCGVFCEAADGPTTSVIFMQLFEESPFNVLMLNSTTGKDYAEDNQVAVISGYDEGEQTAELISRIRQDGEIQSVTSDMHLFGMSLGGLGTLYASYFSSIRRLPVRSTWAMCPVVDLEPQLKAAFTGLRGAYYGRVASNFFTSVIGVIPVLGQVLTGGGGWDKQALFNAAVEISAKTYNNTLPAYWAKNRFANYAPRVSIPTAVVYAKDDPLVPSGINGATLERVKDLAALQSLEIPRGSHCAFAQGLGWPVYSAMMRSYYEAHSNMDPRLNAISKTDLKRVTTQWPAWLENQWNPKSRWIAASWSVKPGATVAKLTLSKNLEHVRLPNDGPYCSDSQPGDESYDCYGDNSVEVSLSGLRSIRLPARAGGAAEANRIERFLNTHTILTDARGNSLVGTGNPPAFITTRGFYEF